GRPWAFSASNAWCRVSRSGRCACRDLLGVSPQSVCYLTPEVYPFLTHFRGGFRLCPAPIPPQSTGLKADRQKRYFSQGFGVARFGVPISAWPEVSCA